MIDHGESFAEGQLRMTVKFEPVRIPECLEFSNRIVSSLQLKKVAERRFEICFDKGCSVDMVEVKLCIKSV